MRCNHCGTEIKEGMKFCPVCGKEQGVVSGSAGHGTGTIFEEIDSGKKETEKKPMEENGSLFQQSNSGNKKPEKKRSKGKKIKRILLLLLLMIVVLGIGGTVFYINSSARTIVQQIEKGKYDTVKQTYERDVKNNFVQEMLFNRLAKDSCKSTLSNFQKGKMEYEEAGQRLKVYQDLNSDALNDFFAEQITSLNNLHDSIEAYEKAEKLYAAGDYAKAMETYAKVVEEDEHYEDAQTKLSECVDKYKSSILSQTKNPNSIEEYEEAIETISIAVKVVKDDKELSGRLNELEKGYAELLKSEALSNGTQYIKDGKFKEIFELLKKAIEKNSGDEELTNLQKTAEDEYVKNVQNTVDGYLEKDQYDDAIKYLKSAAEILNTNSTIKDLLTKVQGNKPVPLSDLKISESDRFEEGKNLSVMEDNIGNVYSPGNLYKLDPWGDYLAYATYYIKGEYTRITGTIAVADDSEKDTGIVTIYDENEKILYTSGDMTRTTAPVKVDVDISGAQWITISAEVKDGWSFKCFISDFVFYKD